MRDDHTIYVDVIGKCPFHTREGGCAAPYRMRRMPSPLMHLPRCDDDKMDELGADDAPPKDCPLRRDGALILFAGEE